MKVKAKLKEENGVNQWRNGISGENISNQAQ
jgi:hypothetical protein